MRRLGDLQIEAGDAARGETAGLGEAETREAIEIYTQLLEQQPDYARADMVLYQLSRAWESLGDSDKALDVPRSTGHQVSGKRAHRRGPVPPRRDPLRREALCRGADGL